MTKDECQQRLWAAMRHLAFAVEICLNQVREGRYYAFEHPASAMSWSTGMIQSLMNTRGAQRIVFDFCMLGMKTYDAAGMQGHAMKKTAVLTNSGHLSALLSKARCNGEHRHIQLEGGRAKACEEYTEYFCDAVCRATRLEIKDEEWLTKVYERSQKSRWWGALRKSSRSLTAWQSRTKNKMLYRSTKNSTVTTTS